MLIQTSLSFVIPYLNAKIIDIGIQQNGIENCVPSEISYNKYIQIKELTDNNTEFNNSYIYNETNNNYTLNKTDATTIHQLEGILAAPLAYLSSADNKSQSYDEYCKSSTPEIIKQVAIKASKDEMISNGIDINKIQMTYLGKIGIIVLLISLFVAVVTYIVNILISTQTLKIAKSKRHDLFNSILEWTNDEINKFSESSLITRATNDIQVIQNFSGMVLWIIVLAPINIIVGVVLALKTAPMLWWILLVPAFAILISAIILIKFCTPIFGKIQTQIDKINLITREKLSGIFISRAFNNANIDNKKFKDNSRPLFKSQLLIGRIMAIINPIINLGFAAICMFVILLGSYYINFGSLQVGNIYAFTMYLSMITTAFTSVGMFIGSLPRANVAIQRIEEVINFNNSSKNTTEEDSLKNTDTTNFEIRFNNVYYSYTENENYALENINLLIKQGQSIGIIGDTGSGKSSLVKLLLKLQSPSKGEILFNGTNIHNINNIEYKKLFSYAPQESFLFSGEIADNILFSVEHKLSDDELMKYIEIAQASDFIKDKSKTGLHKKIYQDSTNISGGQKQRISIARALARNAPILIFDDCFSSLDYEIENKIMDKINTLANNKTKIYVSSRISTIKNCDKIIVFDGGKVVGNGKYSDLLNSCVEFVKIVNSQSSSLDKVK